MQGLVTVQMYRQKNCHINKNSNRSTQGLFRPISKTRSRLGIDAGGAMQTREA